MTVTFSNHRLTHLAKFLSRRLLVAESPLHRLSLDQLINRVAFAARMGAESVTLSDEEIGDCL